MKLKAEMDSHTIPGVAIATIGGDAVVRVSVGVANKDTAEIVTDTTVFEAASLSKPVFAYIVLKLAQKGVIDLDKPLYEYGDFGPPEMRADENYKKLTARMILSHQAGLPNEFSSPDTMKYLSAVGTQFDYSGVAYQFLAEVVEHITSTSLEVLAQEEFAKIGMTNSSFMPPTGCSLIRLPDEEQEPSPEFVQKLLSNTADRQGQLSIILHKDKLFVAERDTDGSIHLKEKDSSQIDEGVLQAIKVRFTQIPPFFWSKPISVEARELPLVTNFVGHPPKHAAVIAVGHCQDGSPSSAQRFYMVHPAASLYTTTVDYARFLKACIEDPYIKEEMFKPVVTSLKDKDTKVMGQGVPADVLEQLSWGLGVGLQKSPNGDYIAFHWGDNGTGRNFTAINLSTQQAVVCFTNSANGPFVFQKIAEPVVGDLQAVFHWLSKREQLDFGLTSAMESATEYRHLLKVMRGAPVEDGFSNEHDDDAPTHFAKT
jgi:CubicO group peptidase (beta-lactamase class C family)